MEDQALIPVVVWGGPLFNISGEEFDRTFFGIRDTDILAEQPWDLPGMDNDVGWYFWKRKTKTEKSKKIDRVIKKDSGNYRWYQYYDVKKIKDNDNTKWGEKRWFRHEKIKGDSTGWLKKEYVLDSSRVGVGRDEQIALCIIENKHGGCEESLHVGSSDRIPQPNYMIQNAAVPSTLGINYPRSPWIIDEFSHFEYDQYHSEDYWPEAPVDNLQSPMTIDGFSDFEFDEYY